MNVIRRS